MSNEVIREHNVLRVMKLCITFVTRAWKESLKLNGAFLRLGELATS
jgi:hypothetical protein